MSAFVIRGLVGIARLPFLTLIATGALLVWAASLVDDRLKVRRLCFAKTQSSVLSMTKHRRRPTPMRFTVRKHASSRSDAA